MYFVFSGVSMLLALFILGASGEAGMADSKVVLWGVALAFFVGGLLLAKKGIAGRKLKKQAAERR